MLKQMQKRMQQNDTNIFVFYALFMILCSRGLLEASWRHLGSRYQKRFQNVKLVSLVLEAMLGLAPIRFFRHFFCVNLMLVFGIAFGKPPEARYYLPPKRTENFNFSGGNYCARIVLTKRRTKRRNMNSKVCKRSVNNRVRRTKLNVYMLAVWQEAASESWGNSLSSQNKLKMLMPSSRIVLTKG